MVDQQNNADKNGKKSEEKATPKMPERKIPSSFESSAIMNAKFVVEGAAERISQTKLPATEQEGEKPREKPNLRVRSDQPTVMLPAPLDFQNECVSHDEKSKVNKNGKNENAKSAIGAKAISRIDKNPKQPATTANNGETAKSTIKEVKENRKEKVRKQLEKLQAEQTELRGKTQMQLVKEKKTVKKASTNGSEDQQTSRDSEYCTPSTPTVSTDGKSRRGTSTTTRPRTKAAKSNNVKPKQTGCCSVS